MAENASEPPPGDPVRFRFPGGREHTLKLPPSRSDSPSAFLIGMKKGGSTLLDKLSRPLMRFTNLVRFDYPGRIFARGEPEETVIEDIDGVFQRPGYAFGVFRWLPNSDVFDLARWIWQPQDRAPKVLLLLRDPRDALVSLYYSQAQSHVIPESGPLHDRMLAERARLQAKPLDDYVLEQAPMLLRHYLRTLQLLAVRNIEIMRYEDIIYDKLSLVGAIARTIGATDLPPGLPGRIVARHDIFPKTEQPDQHVRQVHPGNFRVKLAPDTIAALDARFRPILTSLDYETQSKQEI